MSDYKIYAKYNDSIVEVMSQPSKLSELTDDLGSSPTHTHSQYLTKTDASTSYQPKGSYAASSHTHTTTQVYEPSYINGSISPLLQAKVNNTRACRTMFLPSDQIIIEKTTDGGTTWVDAGYTDNQKMQLFAQTRASWVNIPLLNGVKSKLCGLRITITAMKYNVPSGTAETSKYGYWNSTYVKSTERYCTFNDMYLWVSANSDTIGLKIEAATGSASTTWKTISNQSANLLTGWSGSDYVNLSGNIFGGGISQTTQYWNWRFTFMTMGTTSSGGETLATIYTTSSQSIGEISIYGQNCWTTPNNFVKGDHAYSWDSDQNVTFPAKVTASSFSGNITGNCSGTATKATQDASGNVITTTYATKAEDAAKLPLSGGTMQGALALASGSTTTTPSTSDSSTKIATTEYVKGQGYITSSGSITGNAATATKATKDASGNVITETYTPLDLGVWSAS